MKHTTTTTIALCILGLALSSHATAVPTAVPYTGFLQFEDGTPFEGDVDVEAALYEQAEDGTPVWGPHTFEAVPVEGGVLRFALGEGGSPTLDATVLEAEALWLAVRIDDTPLAPRQRLLSVPYALRASDAERLGGADAASFVTEGELAGVAFSGAYGDLLAAPDLSVYALGADLQPVCFSGSWQDLVDAPDLTALVATADLATVALSGAYADLEGAPDLTGFARVADLHAIATSGSFLDLQDVPEDADTLALLDCEAGWLAVFDGAGWACSPAAPEAGHAATADYAGEAGTATTAATATTAQRALASDSADDLACLGCVDETELGFEVATQAELDAVEAAIPGSVDGLAGGAIGGDTAVQGTLAATTVTQDGNVVCDVSGNCGPTLADLDCASDEVALFNGSVWACKQRLPEPPTDCTGPWMALRFDGSAWQCLDLRTTGLSGGHANGFELTDEWGYVWDGVQKAPRSWAEASADCAARGGRLPTATEIFRNNATDGTGSLTDTLATAPLWTLLPAEAAEPSRALVRLSDGTVSERAETESEAYRCVWPDYDSSVFDGDFCHAPAGESCKAQGHLWNLDRRDRPAMDFLSAAYECRFYHGFLVDIRMAEDAIHEGWPNPSYEWLWTPTALSTQSGHVGQAVYRWDRSPDPGWLFIQLGDLLTAELEAPRNTAQFRCAGLRRADIGVEPTTPACRNDVCFTAETGRGAIVADGANRPALTWAAAAEECRSLGGSLPDLTDVHELVHSGWSSASTAALWTTQPMYIDAGQYGLLTFNWTANGSAGWLADYVYDVQMTEATYARPFRCIWREHREARGSETTCTASEIMLWEDERFLCDDGAPGSSCDQSGGNCRAYPEGAEFVDAWGNAWDSEERTSTTYDSARALCQAMGGRLPYPTELYRVRAEEQSLVDPLPNATYTYLWTMAPAEGESYRTTIEAQTGAVVTMQESVPLPYRCIWPAVRGDILHGHQCYGAPAEGCFRTTDGVLWMDRYDRPRVPRAAASWECAAMGGRLPYQDELAALIHDGAPNGSGEQLALAEPLTEGPSASFRYATASWAGTGGADWQWDATTTAAASGLGYEHYRCVFSQALR